MPTTEQTPKQCELWNVLSRLLDDCADDNGPGGCSICNMCGSCERWHTKVNNSMRSGRSLRQHEYQTFMREFQKIRNLKQVYRIAPKMP